MNFPTVHYSFHLGELATNDTRWKVFCQRDPFVCVLNGQLKTSGFLLNTVIAAQVHLEKRIVGE